MEENKKKRIRLVDNSDVVWAQRRAAEENKNVHSNIVQNDSVLYRNAMAAKKAQEKLYAEKTNQPQARDNIAERQRKMDNARIRENLEVRNNILRQEERLGINGALSFEDIRRAQESSQYVGRRDPLKVKRKDVRGLEGKEKRKRRSKHKLLPSERRHRLNRTRLERNRKKLLEKTARKELVITDANGKRISVDRLRKLRGLSKSSTPRYNKEFAKRYEKTLRREQSRQADAKQQQLLKIRKRDEYTR